MTVLCTVIRGFSLILVYGLLMLIFKIKETQASVSKRINGAVYPLLAIWRDEHAVAINDAAIRLKLQMLRFVAKCFCP